MNQSDADRFIATMRDSRLIERFRIFYALWHTVELDLTELGVAFETRARVSAILNDLASVVLVTTRANGEPPPTPPAA